MHAILLSLCFTALPLDNRADLDRPAFTRAARLLDPAAELSAPPQTDEARRSIERRQTAATAMKIGGFTLAGVASVGALGGLAASVCIFNCGSGREGAYIFALTSAVVALVALTVGIVGTVMQDSVNRDRAALEKQPETWSALPPPPARLLPVVEIASQL